LLVNRAGVDYKATFADVKKGFGPQLVNPKPGDVSATPAFAGGTGTQADPFIITPSTVGGAGGTAQSAQQITVAGVTKDDIVEFLDKSTGAGARFKQPIGLVPGTTWTGRLVYEDKPPSGSSTTYTGDLQLGTTYFRWVVTQQTGVAPDISAVTLSDVPGGDRYTSVAFPIAVEMAKEGQPTSTKKLKAYVEGTLKSAAQTSAIVSIGPQPPAYLIERSLRFDGTASLTRGTYAGTGTMALWYKSDLPNTAQTIMAGLPQVTPGNSDWNFLLATGVTPAEIGKGFKGYLADVQFVDAQTKADGDFRNADGTPKAYAGTYGTNGFWLKFSDNSTAAALGTDTSGNGNNWTPNNLSVTAGAGNDSLVDTPTSYGTDTGAGGSVRGNYCTWNPLGTAGPTPSNGNLDIASSSTAGNRIGTILLTSGKWYWECVGTGYVGAVTGIGGEGFTGSASSNGSRSIGYWFGGVIYWDGGSYTSGIASYTSSDIIGIAVDMTAGTVAFYKNNSLQYTATFGSGTVPNLSTGVFPSFNTGNPGSTAHSVTANFGQRPFAYAAPSGFKALVKVPDMVLTLADSTGLANFAANDAVTEVGNGDNGTGTVKAVNAAGNTLTLNGLPTGWDVGSAVKGPLKVQANVKLYCKLNATGAVTDLQSADPGFTAWPTTGGPTTYNGTLTFPALLPSGAAPDADMPAGTHLKVEVEASNASGTDTQASATITPA
jgi:hypothetical protein